MNFRTLAPLCFAVSGALVVACADDKKVPVYVPPSQDEPDATPPPQPIDATSEICPDAQGVYAAQPETSNATFLVDRSGSMQIKLTDGTTRWIATKKGFFDLLGKLPSTMRAGAMMFPQGDAPITCCSISPTLNDVVCNCATGELPGIMPRCNAAKYTMPISIADLTSSQVDDIKAYISSSDKSFYWGTPLAPSLDAAIALTKADTLPGVKSVILFTDGIPTSCDSSSDPTANDIQHAVDKAAAGYKAGVRTFVMGVIDGTKGARANFLSPIAKAGGTARAAGCETDNSCFYALNAKTFATDIAKALDDISLQAFDCSFELPQVTGGSNDLSKVNVQLQASTTTVVPRDSTHTDGWDILPDLKHFQLYGSACNAIKSDAKAQVQVVVGCKTQGQ